jgi:hypothetical protein
MVGYSDAKSNGKESKLDAKARNSAERLRYFFALPWVLPGDGDARPENFSLKVSFVPLEEGHMPKVLFFRPAVD